jgi:Omp85 superfamily domain
LRNVEQIKREPTDLNEPARLRKDEPNREMAGPIRINALGRVLALSLISLLVSASSVMGQADASVPAADSSTPAVPDAGWPDMSAFLDKKYGFLPVGTLITEPAVGLGGALGLTFINAPLSSGTPDITFVGGMGTVNGSKGAFGGDMRHWFDRRLETRAAIVYATVNLDFYGVGEDPILVGNPLAYNLKPAGGLLEARYRVGSSPIWVGLSYAYAKTLVAFEAEAGTAGVPEHSRTSKMGGIGPSLTLDRCDNFFTPTRGSYVEATANIFGPALGGDEKFQRSQITAIQYVPLPRALFVGVRAQAAASSEDTPFYFRPFIYQRGVPAMRYLGEEMAQIEVELRWQFWNRFSAVGFGGTGAAWVDDEDVDSPTTVTAGGAGFRYELARKYGIHMGVDVAFGPDGPAFYVQWGSAWIRR